jgi:hypothetical protein
MDIATATYAELKDLRDRIDVQLRELERETFELLQQTMKNFGLNLKLQTGGEPKQRRKRRTKAEIEAARAQAE